MLRQSTIVLANLLVESLYALRVDVQVLLNLNDALSVMLVLHFHASVLAHVNVVPECSLSCPPLLQAHVHVKGTAGLLLAIGYTQSLSFCVCGFG